MVCFQQPTKVFALTDMPSLSEQSRQEFQQQVFLNSFNDWNALIEQSPNDLTGLINRENPMASPWQLSTQKFLFAKASSAKKLVGLSSSNKALADYQIGDITKAEAELRTIIRKYPMFADARAALSALLWRKGAIGEARSHWTAAVGLDNRYINRDWLVETRRWPPQPINDLFSFLSMEVS